MEALSFIILAFTIYSIIASMNSKGKNPPGGRPRFPGDGKIPPPKPFPRENHYPPEMNFPREMRFPPEIPQQPEIPLPRTEPERYRGPQSHTANRQENAANREAMPYSRSNPSTTEPNFDPYKDMELAQAQGREGEWGDEGRPAGIASRMSAEGRAGVEGRAGTEGIASSEGLAGTEGTFGTEGAFGTEGTAGLAKVFVPKGSVAAVQRKSSLRQAPAVTAMAVWDNALTQQDLVRGIIWSEILGKPRAMKPYRGPRQ